VIWLPGGEALTPEKQEDEKQKNEAVIMMPVRS
jgi:hypothetical protein